MTAGLLEHARELQRRGMRAEAIDCFRRILAADEGAAERWYEFGYLLKADSRFDEAFDAYGRALVLGVSRPEEVHLNRAVILSDHLRRDDDAEAELQRALALAPGYLPALLNLGNLHEERGRREQALACYERLLARPPGGDHDDLRGEALARMVRLRPPGAADDPVFARLERAIAEQPANLARINLLFALGHARDRLGDAERAFDAWSRANRWLSRQAGRRYSREGTERLVDAMIEAFPAAASTAGDLAAEEGSAVPEPLFVCGMYRSGSTLVEQVLAAHPQVTAGGELNELWHLASRTLAPFPQSMPGLDASRFGELAAVYRRRLARLFPQAQGRYVTDKRPDNFLLLGLAKRLFPRARIVHTVRNPMDNGLSIFMQHLNPVIAGYSCDLADIGHYHGQYRRLMAHWQSLWGDDIHAFDYDAFVADPEPRLRALLRFVDLEWDPGCLDFHRLDNTVKTASYWQVRQPLYRTAQGRWRRYGTQLQPLRQALAAAGIDAGGS